MVAETVDTAEPTADSAAAAQQAPPEVTQPETDAAPAPQTEPQGTSPETVQAEAPAPPDLNALLADLPDEDFAKLDRVSRHGESIRRTSESEAQRRQREADAQWLAQDEYLGDLTKAIALDDDGNPALDRDSARSITTRMAQASLRGAVGELGALLDAEVPPDFALTREESGRLAEAVSEFRGDAGKAYGVVREWVGLIKRAAVEQATPELRKALEKDIRAELASDQKAADLESADAERTEAPRPTRTIGGSAGNPWTSQQQIHNAHAKGEISTDQFLELVTGGGFHDLPQQ